MSADCFFFSFVLLYLIHMHEEYWTGFTRMFTPPRFTGALAGGGNINWDTYWTALLTGPAIMVVVPGIAFLGHKVLR
jgi:hypothetical protein